MVQFRLSFVLFLIFICEGVKAFSVTHVFPEQQSLNAGVQTGIRITFDQAINGFFVSPSSFSVFGHWSGKAVGAVSYTDENRTLVFTPASSFNAGEWVCVTLSKEMRSISGENLQTGYSWHFWIKPSPGNLDFVELDRISSRTQGEGHIQTYGAHGGDLNEDGFSDFFIPNEISNDCRVFLNDGTGRYHDFEIYPIPNGARPSTNESSDFNRDSHLDLAVGNSTGDSITIFLGNGTGGFQSIRNYAADDGIRGLAVADVDGDGDTDIITANRAGSSVTLMLNNEFGSFSEPIFLDADAQGETACATADANGDGILDLFVGAHSSGEISLLLGDGNAHFFLSDKVSAGGNGTWMVAAGDVNGDGHADVACVNAQSSNTAVILSDGTGGLLPAVTYPTGGFPIAIDLGDIDGDEDLDLMTSNYSGNNWTYWENDGTGNMINRRTLAAEEAGSCATFHDRDNDGDLDMTGIDEEADLVFLFENTGVSSVQTPGIVTLAVYPNPSVKGWFVSLPAANSSKLILVDASGQHVLAVQCTGEETIFIPSQDFIPGAFVVRVYSEDDVLLGQASVILTSGG